MSSKFFDDFDSTIQSVNDLNVEIVHSLNLAVKEERYGLLSEVNPKHSNQPTVSKDWSANEFAKIWIIDKIAQQQRDPAKPGPIKAVSLAQILEVRDTEMLLN